MKYYCAAILAICLFVSSLLGEDVVVGQEAGAILKKAEDTRWTYEPDVPQSLAHVRKKPRKNKPAAAPVLLWLPKGEETTAIRGMLMVAANSDSKAFMQYKGVREVLAKYDMAAVYMRFPLQNDLDKVQDLCDHLAEMTGIAGFRNAPWITFGKSSQGKFPYHMAWVYPDRTIATISYHAETPEWPAEARIELTKKVKGGGREFVKAFDVKSKIKEQTIIHISANGETEWGGTWWVHARPCLLNYRQYTNLLPHIAVVKNVDHGNYVDVDGSEGEGQFFPGSVHSIDVWDYLALSMDKALSLRLPDEVLGENAVLLKQVDMNAGYLINPFAVEDIFAIPQLPLKRGADGDFVKNVISDNPPNGFRKIPADTNLKVDEGTPLVALVPDRSPTEWLISEGLRGVAIDADPVFDSSNFSDMTPILGGTADVEGREITFRAITDRERGQRKDGLGGLAMKGLLQPIDHTMTAFAYHVLKVDQPGTYEVRVPHTMAVRNKAVLNGVPVDNHEVVELEKGLYRYLLVIRKKGITWGHIEPYFASVAPERVEEAKRIQKDKLLREKLLKERFVNGPIDPWTFIKPASEVPEAERRNWFWIADREQAEAWLHLHDIQRLAKEKASGQRIVFRKGTY